MRAHTELDHAPTASFEDHPCHESSCTDLLYLPDMFWLGGSHDGYSRSTSLSAYVWLRRATMKTRRGYLALWQSALSFGVLESITDLCISESLLLTSQPDGTFVMTGAKISALIFHWLFAHPSNRDSQWVSRWYRSAEDTVSWALQAINEEMLSRNGERWDIVDSGAGEHRQNGIGEVFASLATLSQWLYHFVISVQDGFSPDLRQQMNSDISLSLLSTGTDNYASLAVGVDVYQKKLLANGWCPYAVLLRSNLFTLAYASTFFPYNRNPTKDSEHATCTSDRCVAWHNLDTAEYVTRHTPTCPASSCAFLSPSLAPVYGILSSNRIPIMVYDGQSLSVRCADDGPYVAISHVWADGLGSTTETGLPICQISRIAGYARQFVPDGAFWVDSLCVPEKKDLRKSAIRLMAETYRRADAVVVFDDGIRSLCTSTAPIKEITFRIQTSAWMQRIWTLQEAVLARELHFEFADGLFPDSRLSDAWATSMKPVPSSLGIQVPSDPLLLHYTDTLLNMMLMKNSQWSSGRHQFRQIVYLLGRRTTSKPEDETVAVAALMDVNVSKLLDQEGADARMRVFLTEFKTLPVDIIFGSQMSSARLPFPGFRWAPRTLTNTVTGAWTGLAQCTPEGLMTDDELALVLLPPSNFVNVPVDAGSDIMIDNVTTGMSYVARGEGNEARQHRSRWNGLLALPSQLSTIPEESFNYIDTVAVHISPRHWSNLTDQIDKDSGFEHPVVCEYLFSVKLMHMNSAYRAGLRGGIVAGKPSDLALVEGMFLSARIILT